MNSERNKILTGVSGEYFVAGELSRRGYLASITLRNTKGVDILCSNASVSKSVGIQVKTKSGLSRNWILSEKCETYHANDLYYVFVNISERSDEAPKYTIVPSKVVADFIRKSHANWLKSPKKNGDPRQNSNMRKFQDLEEKYLNRWDLLGLD
jgi:hypothetical protein